MPQGEKRELEQMLIRLGDELSQDALLLQYMATERTTLPVREIQTQLLPRKVKQTA